MIIGEALSVVTPVRPYFMYVRPDWCPLSNLNIFFYQNFMKLGHIV